MNRRTFLRNGLWLLGAPTIIRAGVLPSSRRIAITAPAASAYTAYASVFDGTNDYMTRGGALTGNSDGKQVTFSFWLDMKGGDGSTYVVYYSDNDRLYVIRNSDNTLGIIGKNTSGTGILNVKTITTLVAGGGWKHCLLCADMATAGARHIYINGLESTSVTTFTDDTIDRTGTDAYIGWGGGSKLNAELCEFYYANEYISDTTKFASGGKPISLGSDGSTPTGTAPIIYFRDPYDSFETNRGTGGDFTVTGALTQGTPP